jgi:hypothetical protein
VLWNEGPGRIYWFEGIEVVNKISLVAAAICLIIFSQTPARPLAAEDDTTVAAIAAHGPGGVDLRDRL